LSYKNGDKELLFEPLKGQIDPEKSGYTVGKVKIEIRLVKMAQGRWGALVGDSPDRKSRTACPLTVTSTASFIALAAFSTASPSTAPTTTQPRKPRKNWDGITSAILDSDKAVTSEDDPNAGGDSTVNEFFQKIYADADEDTKRAMMKSYVESGGTTLSTNWDEVRKAPVEVKPPEGSEWKKWAA
jgi:suppressor of G2 allele of SKP1